MSRRKHLHRGKVAERAAIVGTQAAVECKANMPDEVSPEQAAFLIEMTRFNATRNFPRSAAERIVRKQQAKRMEARAKELFPGIPVEVV